MHYIYCIISHHENYSSWLIILMSKYSIGNTTVELPLVHGVGTMH